MAPFGFARVVGNSAIVCGLGRRGSISQLSHNRSPHTPEILAASEREIRQPNYRSKCRSSPRLDSSVEIVPGARRRRHRVEKEPTCRFRAQNQADRTVRIPVRPCKPVGFLSVP